MEVVVRETGRPVGSPEGRHIPGFGVVGETLDLRVIQDLVRQTRLGTSGYVYAVDARGAPIAHPNSDCFHESFLGSSPGDQGARLVRPDRRSAATSADKRC